MKIIVDLLVIMISMEVGSNFFGEYIGNSFCNL